MTIQSVNPVRNPLFTDEVIRFFENHQIYHLESNGEALIIFNKIKLARTDETIAFIDYGKELATLLNLID